MGNYSHSAGRGAGPHAFAGSYSQVADRFLNVWSRSVISIGGAAVGFTVTANNYAAADHATAPSSHGPAPKQQPPHVIHSPPHYGSVPSLDFGFTSNGDINLDAIFDDLPDEATAVIKPVVDQIIGATRVIEVLPFGSPSELTAIANAWRNAAQIPVTTGTDLDNHIAYITDPHGNGEWQSAMRQFCRSIWGTSAYGKNQEGYEWRHTGRNDSGIVADRQPILTVLSDTAKELSAACDTMSSAVDSLRTEVWRIYKEAAKKTWDDIKKIFGLALPGLVALFISHIDTGTLDKAIDGFTLTGTDLGSGLSKLTAALGEAFLSAPTFNAEEARAEAFGARSLTSFKGSPLYTVPGDDERNHDYPVDLANQEGIDNSHVIDRHVGKTDDQLRQRLRDNTNRRGQIIPSSASTFTDLQSAQRLTQDDIDHHTKEIKEWIDGSPDNGDTETFEYPANEDTGRSVSRDDYRRYGSTAPARTTHGVSVTLKYDDSLNPPFVVLTSFPQD